MCPDGIRLRSAWSERNAAAWPEDGLAQADYLEGLADAWQEWERHKAACAECRDTIGDYYKQGNKHGIQHCTD
jgi:hypothetical protein